MPSNIHAQTLRSLTGIFLFVVTILLAGCATMQPDAETEAPFAPDWGSALRMPSATSELGGLSDTSRQIERNLGLE